MAYFKLSLLTKAYDKSNVNKYIKNVISEFYGNNIDEDLLRYERENNLQSSLTNGLVNIYTKTYTYNEKLNIHQQGQADLTFSLDKMILDDDTWKENPFASKLKSGGQVLLEDKYNNTYLFTIKDITYTITENNIVYNFTCQDSFSYQLAKQNDGYTINNDINSKDFIGALSIDYWAEKIVKECKIAYKYLKLETPLYLCKDGTATNTINTNKPVLKVLKQKYLNTTENADLYEKIPFSCSSTTANGALISLGEQIGLVLNTATVLLEPENNKNFISLITYFWFELSKKDVVNGLAYSPFRNVKTFNLSQKGDSLITTLNINSRTLSNDEVITALPTVSPFFINYFNSSYWKKYSNYYPGMYTNALYGPQYNMSSATDQWDYGTANSSSEIGKVYIRYNSTSHTITFSTKIDTILKAQFSLYDTYVFQSKEILSSFSYWDTNSNLKVATASNSTFSVYISSYNILSISVDNTDFADMQTANYINDFDITAFFKKDFSDEDKIFARIADQLPWLENKLIDYSYFLNAGLLSKIQKQDINNRINNELRKVNADILLNAAAYYGRIHSQTKYLAEMTDRIDSVGAEISSIVNLYKQKEANNNYDANNLILRWSLLQANISDAAAQTGVANSSAASTFMNLYETTSDYMRKFLNARQRCLKNLYNFRSYYETPLDPLYKQYYAITLTIQDTTPTQEEPSGADNIYRFEPQPKDEYRVLSWSFVEDFPQFFITDNDSTYLIDYNNINLYNNDIQHSIFDKENHLITTDNVSDLDLHCYQDVLQKCGEENYYDKDTQYLRQVFFVKLRDICSYFTVTREGTEYPMTPDDIDSLTDANLFLNFATYDPSLTPSQSDPRLLYPCQSKIYKEDRNYLVCNKMYEDGIPFSGGGICLLTDSVIKVNGTTYVCKCNQTSKYITLLDKPRYVGAWFSRTDLKNDTINFIDKNADPNSTTVRLDGSVFYQPIDTINILRNYLYRKNFSDTYIKEDYEFISLNDPTDDYKNALFHGNAIDTSRYAPDTTRYVTVDDAEVTYSQSTPGNNKIGWGVATNSAAQIWHIVSAIATIGGGLGLLPTGFRTLGSVGLLTSALNLKNKMLVYGGYSSSNTHLNDELFSDFAPYASKEVKNDSLYIQNFPLDTIYDSNGENPITLVTATNYQNFYTRTDSSSTDENSFSLGSEGAYKSVDYAQYQVGKSEKDLCTGFISDFPIHYFYTTKPINGTITTTSNSGIAFTFGNLLNNSTYFESFKYKKTMTYKKTSYSSLYMFEDDASFLVIDTTEVAFNITDVNSWPSELNQYIHYDIINHGKIMNKAQFKALPSSSTNRYMIYLIIDGVIKNFSSNTVIDSDSDNYTEMVTSITEMFTKRISDQNGRCFNIDEYQDSEGIIENLYYIEQDVLSTQSTLNYSLKEHLYDNTYEWYNKDEERVYTTNQLFGNLLYKKPQSYTYYVFDKGIDQYIKMYRYNCNSITPDIFTYKFDVSNINNSTVTHCTGESPYDDFKYDVYIIQISSGLTGEPTNGDFWYKFTMETNNKIPLREHAALIESDLQLYWNEAYAASLLCDIFVPDEWRIKQDKIINRFNVISKPQTGSSATSLNSVYIPKINKTTDKQYIITWKDVPPQVENSEIFSYDELSYEQKIEVDKMLERTQNVSTNNLYFTKISDNISFYTIQTGGCNWATFLNQAVGVYLPDYTGWNGTAITYLTSHFVDAGMSNYELLLERRDDLWRDFYNEYPYLFLESSYTNDSATTSEDLLTMAKYAFEDQKYPEKSYSISLIDLVQDVETLDNENGTYKPVYYREPELHIGEGIKISVEDYTQDRDDIYEALSQLLFITDISRDLRNDGNCQLTVNTIKYQDKLIRRLAKMIRRNPLN